MLNSEFLAAIYGKLRNDYGWTTSFASDPGTAPGALWLGSAWTGTDAQKTVIDQRKEDNNYYSVGVMYARDGKKRRSKEVFGRLAVLLADDISPAGLKDLVGNYSYALETSKENYKVGVMLDPEDADTRNPALIDALLHAMSASGFIKADSSGNNPVRYARLPVGTNTKKRDTGMWSQRVLICNLDEVYPLGDAAKTFGLNLDDIKRGIETPRTKIEATGDASDLFKAIITPNLEERDYHDPLLKISASLIAGGLRPGATVNVIRSIMLASKPEGDPAQLDRWQQRFGSELTRMVSTAEKYAPKEPDPIVSTTLLETIEEVTAATKNIKWLVKNLIPQDAMGMLFGASGTFKSFIAIDLCLSVAHGVDWTKHRTATGGVVYVAAEGGAGVARRIDAWHKACGAEFPKNFHICRVPLLLSAKDEIGALRKAIAALPQIPALVVVDTLSQTFSGDENSSSDIGAYLRTINSEIRAAFNCTVLVIHHTGHNATERPRGSSAITANVDFLIGCYRADAEAMNAKLDVTKQKDGDMLRGLYFDLNRHVLGSDEDGEELTSLVAEFHDAVASVRKNYKGGKYDALILKMLSEKGSCTEAEFRTVLRDTFKLSPDATSMGVRRTLTDLKAALRIQETTPKTWKMAE